MNKFDPKEDGFTHLNIYSKARTKLGRDLSNFANTPFRIPFMGSFHSVEGFWYWWMTGNDSLRNKTGYEAKALGKSLPQIRSHPDERILRLAYKAKLLAHPDLRYELLQCALPIAHYYVYGGKVVVPKEWQWTAELWNEFR